MHLELQPFRLGVLLPSLSGSLALLWLTGIHVSLLPGIAGRVTDASGIPLPNALIDVNQDWGRSHAAFVWRDVNLLGDPDQRGPMCMTGQDGRYRYGPRVLVYMKLRPKLKVYYFMFGGMHHPMYAVASVMRRPGTRASWWAMTCDLEVVRITDYVKRLAAGTPDLHRNFPGHSGHSEMELEFGYLISPAKYFWLVEWPDDRRQLRPNTFRDFKAIRREWMSAARIANCPRELNYYLPLLAKVEAHVR